jgi:hypothetical protein
MSAQRITELAEQIRSGQLQGHAACKALDSWTYLEKSSEADVIHFLYHYVADADIREKDAGYRMSQESRLDNLLRLLG